MAAPSSFVDWDTNGNNTTAIVSGHATDGFVNNEVPTARELNQVLMLTGLWIRYFAALTPRVHSATAFTPQSGSITFPNPVNDAAPASPVYFHSSPAGAAWSPMNYAVLGLKIGTVDWVVRIPAGGGTVTLKLIRGKNDGSNLELVATTTHTLVANPTAVWETVTHTINHTVGAGYAYWLRAEPGDQTDVMMATVNPA